MTEYRSKDGGLGEVTEAALHGIEGGMSQLSRLTVLGTVFPPQISPPSTRSRRRTRSPTRPVRSPGGKAGEGIDHQTTGGVLQSARGEAGQPAPPRFQYAVRVSINVSSLNTRTSTSTGE
jgi:hypothetical protein